MTYRPRVFHDELPFHITGRVNNRDPFPVSLDFAWELFSDYLYFISKTYGIRIHSFVMMPNHFHLIARDPELKMGQAMNYFMRETSKQMGKQSKTINRIWGAPYHASLIDSPLYFLHSYKYVYRNPVRGKITTSPFDYKYSTLRYLVGEGSTIIPLEEDSTLFESFESSVEWLEVSNKEQHDNEIRRALKRKTLKLPRDERNKKPGFLATEESVPEIFRKSRPFPEG